MKTEIEHVCQVIFMTKKEQFVEVKVGDKTYKTRNTGYSSERFGNCEICGEHCSEVFHMVEIGEINSRRYYTGRDFWGHKECLRKIRGESQ